MTKADYISIAKKQLAVDYNANPEDFNKNEPVITKSALKKGHRFYTGKKLLFKMATFGENVVISAHPGLHKQLNAYIVEKEPISLFELPQLMGIHNILKSKNRSMGNLAEFFLPLETPIQNPLPSHWEEVWYDTKEAILPLYEGKRFPNALCTSYIQRRPDMLAVGVVVNGTLAGLAGCSADSEDFWQIGIDVFEPYRNQGIASYLVLRLKNEIIRRGKIPFYSTNTGNLFSKNVALSCGFFPAWIEAASAEH